MKNKDFDKKITGIQAAFQNLANDFTVDKHESNNWEKDSLEANEIAKIAGFYTPSSPGPKKLKAIFNCNEKESSIELSLQTEVIQVQLTGDIVKGLPKKVVVNSEHNIELLVKNTSELNATQINIEIGQLLEDKIVVAEENMSKKISIRILSLRLIK